MNTLKGRSVRFFWVPYPTLVLLFGGYVLYGYNYSAQTLLAWLFWSDFYDTFWEVCLLLMVPLLIMAPFFPRIALFSEKILSTIFFVLLVKLIMILSPTVKAMNNVDYYSDEAYSVIALLFIASIIFILSDDKRRSSMLLVYCSFIAAIVSLQLVNHLSHPIHSIDVASFSVVLDVSRNIEIMNFVYGQDSIQGILSGQSFNFSPVFQTPWNVSPTEFWQIDFGASMLLGIEGKLDFD